MSAKLLHSLTDENPDLKKQIGCMTGIFQLFDRQHVLTGRRIAAHSHKKPPTGHLHSNNGSVSCEPESVHHIEPDSGKTQNNVGENRRISTSSRASLSSSSCSSSFSSLDYKSSQPESQASERIIFAETPSREPTINQPNLSQLGRHSLDFRDVVKDSIYREGRGLSVKTATNEEPTRRVMMHIDSPRPLQLSKAIDGSHRCETKSKARTFVDLNESEKVLARHREQPWYLRDVGESPRSSYGSRDGSVFSTRKDSPQFSYDSREMHRSSLDSRDTIKSTTTRRELPRLSLDSRLRSPKFDMKDLQRSSSCILNRKPDLQAELGDTKRPSSVVAKLMGLEGLPNHASPADGQTGLIKTCREEECHIFPKTNNGSKQSRMSSPRSSPRGPAQSRLRNPDSEMKPESRFPLEPAPWKQVKEHGGSQKLAFKNQDMNTNASNSRPSVYAEIETRLKELEFRQSDRDLRALKQILDAMQSKGLLESKKQEQATNIVSQINDNILNQIGADQSPRLANKRNPLSNRPYPKGASPPRTFESPIVIMKPAKLITKTGIPASSVILVDSLSGLRKPQKLLDNKKVWTRNKTAGDLTPKSGPREPATRTPNSSDKIGTGRSIKSLKTSTKSQQLSRESTGNTGNTGRMTGSVSPRLQQKKLEVEKRSRPPIPLSDSIKPRRQSTKKLPDSCSPRGKHRSKCSTLEQNNDQMSRTSRDTRNLSYQEDEISQHSDSNNSFMSQMDIEATGTDRSIETCSLILQQGSHSPSRRNSKNSVKQKKLSPRLSEEVASLAELATLTPEQPSPVSVLDASFYKDDSPSPVHNISHAFKEVETENSDDRPGEDKWSTAKLDSLSRNNNILSDLTSSCVNRTKLENIGYLVQKLRRLNTSHDEATTDYIASLCENTNPDHRYISEMLLASGLLLRDLGSGLKPIQLHPSGHPINPDLFFVLEQTKASKVFNCKKDARLKFDQDKLHRKLVFDAVNEALAQKLALAGLSGQPWIRTNKVAGENLNAHRLLKELCSDIEQLQAKNKPKCSLDDDEDSLQTLLQEDVRQGSENWVDYNKEVPAVALDVERLIFKDLIDEIVSGEAGNQRAKKNRR